MSIAAISDVPKTQPSAGPVQLSAPTSVKVSANAITITGAWKGAGQPFGLVVRRENTDEKKGFLLIQSLSSTNDEISVTYPVDGLAPGKYVAVLVFNSSQGPQARFSFEFGPKLQSGGNS